MTSNRLVNWASLKYWLLLTSNGGHLEEPVFAELLGGVADVGQGEVHLQVRAFRHWNG